MKKALFVCGTDYQINVYYPIIKKSCKQKNITLDLFVLYDYSIFIQNKILNINVSEYDFCIMLVKDQYISKLFQMANKPCFNTYESMCNTDDKFMTHLILSQHNIKMPKTISGNTEFRYLQGDFERSEQFKNYLESTLGYPIIAKPTDSYGGKGIIFIQNRQELDKAISKIAKKPYIYQEYINENPGTDIRCVVVGDEVIFSILRENKNAVASNLTQGGIAKKIEIDDEYKSTAIRIAKILGLVYCSIDFFNVKGSPIFCEANANPGSIEKNIELTGINQAEKFIEYIYNKLY